MADPPRLSEMLPPLLVAFVLLAAAGLTSGGRWRRVLGLCGASIALLVVWILPAEDSTLRIASTLIACFGVLRVADLCRGRWRARERFAHLVSLVDTRRLVATRRSLDGRGLLAGVSWLIVTGVAYHVLAALPAPTRSLQWVARWAAVLVVVYAGVSAGYSLARAAYAAAGFATPPLHVTPAFARSVQELWGERWARPISTWTSDTILRPLVRRRRPLLGLILAFAASAALHAYVVWVAIGFVRGLGMAVMMFAYFLVQGAVVVVERVLGVRRWPSWAGHAWTVALMLLTSPLFLEPAVRTVGR